MPFFQQHAAPGISLQSIASKLDVPVSMTRFQRSAAALFGVPFTLALTISLHPTVPTLGDADGVREVSDWLASLR